VIPKKALTVQEIQKLDQLIDKGVPSQNCWFVNATLPYFTFFDFTKSYMVENASTEIGASVRTQPIMPTSEII
jgi:hypothetical protein